MVTLTGSLPMTSAPQPPRGSFKTRMKCADRLSKCLAKLNNSPGSQKCECRKQRAQRTHLACCYQAWFALKLKAQMLTKSIHATNHDLLSDFLRAELRNPHIAAL